MNAELLILARECGYDPSSPDKWALFNLAEFATSIRGGAWLEGYVDGMRSERQACVEICERVAQYDLLGAADCAHEIAARTPNDRR